MQTAIYVVDDPTAPLKPPRNKGNEAMVYLTYIIDNYDSLPNISVFVHAHAKARHTDDLLYGSMSKSLERLRRAKVLKDGYFNLRCNWEPGCPVWLDLENENNSASKADPNEARTLRQAWVELHPGKAVPQSVAQAYGAQFAASREHIQTVPLSRWRAWRAWLLDTNLSNYQSGRIWEYTWQYVFTGDSVFCPVLDVCYCEGYGICFESKAKFSQWWHWREESQQWKMEYLQLKSSGKEDGLLKEKIHFRDELLKLVLEEAMRRGDQLGRE